MTDFLKPYQWDIRPKLPTRPNWFKAWPEKKRMSLQIIILHEWETIPWHRSRPMPATAHHKFDYLALGGREYGARHGIWRLLDVLEKHGIKATIAANGLVAELFPDSISKAAGQGHEIAVHQWDQAVFPSMFTSRAEERKSLVKARQALERVSKQAIRGYMSPGPRPTPYTMEILGELKFDWTCDYVDSDIPYLIAVAERPLVAVSYATPGCIDYDLLSRGHIERLEEMKYLFEATYAESARHPMRFSYAVHTHWGGTVGMARVLDEFLTFVQTHEGVWCSTFGDVAAFWREGKSA